MLFESVAKLDVTSFVKSFLFWVLHVQQRQGRALVGVERVLSPCTLR